MESSNAEILKRFHAIEELDNAAATIEAGLAVLQQSKLFTRNHFVVSLLLSVGLERFMKVLLALHTVSKTGQFPSDKGFRCWGHDLIVLRNKVAGIGFDEIALARPAMITDREFILNDPLVNEILETLSDFAKTDRYLHLVGLSKPKHDRAWLHERWDHIERRSAHADEDVLRSGEVDDFLQRATQGVIVCLERYLRALARTVTVSGLNADAKSLGTRVWPFLMRMDEELGSTVYKLSE